MRKALLAAVAIAVALSFTARAGGHQESKAERFKRYSERYAKRIEGDLKWRTRELEHMGKGLGRASGETKRVLGEYTQRLKVVIDKGKAALQAIRAGNHEQAQRLYGEFSAARGRVYRMSRLVHLHKNLARSREAAGKYSGDAEMSALAKRAVELYEKRIQAEKQAIELDEQLDEMRRKWSDAENRARKRAYDARRARKSRKPGQKARNTRKGDARRKTTRPRKQGQLNEEVID